MNCVCEYTYLEGNFGKIFCHSLQVNFNQLSSLKNLLKPINQKKNQSKQTKTPHRQRQKQNPNKFL